MLLPLLLIMLPSMATWVASIPLSTTIVTQPAKMLEMRLWLLLTCCDITVPQPSKMIMKIMMIIMFTSLLVSCWFCSRTLDATVLVLQAQLGPPVVFIVAPLLPTSACRSSRVIAVAAPALRRRAR